LGTFYFAIQPVIPYTLRVLTKEGVTIVSLHPINKRKILLVSAAVVIAIAGLLIARTAFARVVMNTIDPVAKVIDNGRHLVVTGPLTCSGIQQVHLRVIVTQRTTGAVAEGQILFSSTGESQHWEVNAMTQGNETFQEGTATAVAIATTTERGITDDAHQWLVNITLVRE